MSEIYQVSALVPATLFDQVGFVPLKGMEDTAKPKPIRYRGITYKGFWANATVGRLSTTEALTEVARNIRRAGFANAVGVIFTDRRLTSAEKRKFQVLVDLGRDGDVLMVKAGHPACNGLTLAQVRAIASGRTTSWSQVGAAPAGAPDHIALRHTVVDRVFQGRFGVSKKPKSAKGAADGGAAEAARDASVAAIGAWSSARFRSGVCRVPINGVAPSDASVRDFSYKAANPIQIVAPRKRRRDTFSRGVLAQYGTWMKSAVA